MKTCFVTWNRTWGVNCTVVKDAIIMQIKKWTSADNCKDGGEKCLYMVCQTSTVAWQISYFHAQNTHKLFIIRLLRPWMQGKKMSDMVGGWVLFKTGPEMHSTGCMPTPVSIKECPLISVLLLNRQEFFKLALVSITDYYVTQCCIVWNRILFLAHFIDWLNKWRFEKNIPLSLC